MSSKRSRQGPPEGEITTEIHVDLSAIPDYVREAIGRAVLEDFREFMKQPGSEEMLEARISAKNKKHT